MNTARSNPSESPGTIAHRVSRLRGGTWSDASDVLTVEEPLEIRLLQEIDGAIARRSIAVTMRTPGHDFELAAGFLFGESIVGGREDIFDISYCTDEDEPQAQNIVNITLRPGVTFDTTRLERNFYTTSSCGICGKATLESLEVHGCSALALGFSVPAAVIQELPSKLRAAQPVFDRTGGLHAAGLFDRDGNLVVSREDVGRHNALDKLVGAQLLDGHVPLSHGILMLSGRASFELLQKSLAAGISVVAAVGAPSSLAVGLAASFNITLLGFVRDDGFNVYTAPTRIAHAPAPSR